MNVNVKMKFSGNTSFTEEEIEVLEHMFSYAIDKDFYRECSKAISEKRLEVVVREARNKFGFLKGTIQKMKKAVEDVKHGKTS